MCYNINMKIESYNAKKQTAEIIYQGKMRTVSEEAALSLRVDVFKDIPDEILPELLAESEKLLCRKYLYDQISKYSKTKRGYYNKLVEKGYSKPVAKATVDHAEEYGYIDDYKYAERYVELNLNKKGYYKLKSELTNKGVPAATINEVLNALPDQSDEIFVLAQKLAKKIPENAEERAKLARKLASRGFSFDEISTAIDKLCRGSFDD